MANDAASLDSIIRNKIQQALGTPGQRWDVKAMNMPMGDWRDPERRINAIAREALDGWYLLHSKQATVEGRQVMWLHFAVKA